LGNATSAVLLGDTTGSANASLLTGGAFTIGRTVTVQAGSSGTATIGGNTDNNSTFSGAVTLNKDATVTQVATTGANTLTLSGGVSAGTSGTKTLTVNNVGSVTVSTAAIANGSGVVALAKQGSGTLNLNVASTYTGGTTLTGGAITLGADNALGGSTSSFNFNGGTLNANNHRFSVGALSLTASSTLNLVNDSSAVPITFSSASATAGTLTINGWQNNSTRDEIIITSQPSAAFLSEVQFTGFAAGATWIAATGELIPSGVTPVPEPINLALGLFALVGLGWKVVSGRMKANRAATA
jgi:autotransporter-associated beta strand protein